MWNLDDEIFPYAHREDEVEEDHRQTFYELADIKSMSMGSLMLAPYDFGWFMQAPDADILPILATSDKIHRFLPGLNFSDKESAKKTLKSYLIKAETQLGITYVIRMQNMPMGMVMVDTPLYNKKAIGKAIWTVDFFISEALEHKGIVYQSLLRVLSQMKSAMSVGKVYALVDPDNHDCIKVVGKGLFTEISNTGFANKNAGQSSPRVFMIDLRHIHFE